ncbi:MAG: reverse transcriptase family protein, partial [Proteobacteria bacterium]|nr:reverse transcriptase family protein [Pseudomonadota bacterium]
MFFSTQTALGIVDIRSIGFYNIKHSTLQYNLSMQLPQYNKLTTEHVEQSRSKQTCKKHGKHVKLSNSADDPYPWLESQDPRRHMSDEQILRKYIDLTQSILDEEQKEELMQIILKYKSAFSLRDEIGECPNIKVDIEVIDDSPFFVRPFPISEEDKPIMDKQMQRLVSLKILTKNTTSHTSPVMLITRKVTNDKRPVVDFRLLNTRIKRLNTATPLLRDIYQILGKAQSTVLSCVDLKDAFHSLKLTDRAKDYCGILPYFGSPHYRYEVMPMGLSISPCKWIQYIGFVMEKMPYPQNYIAIMDDLLVHSREAEHMDRILDMLKGLVEHGLKLSPKKCQFFRKELVYMGNTFKTGVDGITISPIKTGQEAMLNTPTPTTPKECKSFCGVVNYVSLFYPHLQELLAPIYDLTRKGRPFVWTKLHQDNF